MTRDESVERLPDLGEISEDCKKFISRIIKANRELFILSFLKNKEMCGYDIIKEIFSKYDVFLSQGAVYPILYTLEEEGILRAEYSKGDMRSKNYSLTTTGRDLVNKDTEEFLRALEQLSILMRRVK